MEQPKGFEDIGKQNLVCRFQKDLYGLKQAPRQWFKKLDFFLAKYDFKKLTNHCVFVKKLLDMIERKLPL